jgi:hypothetical protein
MKRTLAFWALAQPIWWAPIAPNAACQTPQIQSGRTGKPWSVEGTVTAGKQPVSGVKVWCQGPCSDQGVLTDENGNYTLKGATASRLRIGGEKDGYSDAGARTVSVRPGNRVEQIDLVMHKEAVVSGHVLDPNGDGLEGTEVVIYEKVYKQGNPALAPRGTARTNDLGEYRIAGLGAGRYVLVTSPKLLQVRKLTRISANREGKRKPGFGMARKMYYPNVDSTEAASTIEVQSGQSIEGIDVRFRNETTFCVSGRSPGGDSTLSVREVSDGGGVPIGAGPVKADEAFELCGLPKGQYKLMMWTSGGSEVSAIRKYTSFSRTEFPVVDRDVEVGTLPIVPPSPLSGTVAVSASFAPPPIPAGLSVGFEPPEDRSIMVGRETYYTSVGSSGSFTLQSAFDGVYRLRVFGLPAGYYIKQFTQGGRDVKFGGVRPKAGPVSILLGCDGGKVDGQVKNKDGLPVPEAMVALLPKEASAGAEVLSQSADQDGRFSFFTDLPPGDYFATAFSGLTEGEQQSLTFLRANLQGAVEITVAPMASKQVVLALP